MGGWAEGLRGRIHRNGQFCVLPSPPLIVYHPSPCALVGHRSLSITDVLHAVGGFLAWVSLLKFCEWSAELYMLMLAVKASFGRIIRFIFTVSPVYIGKAGGCRHAGALGRRHAPTALRRLSLWVRCALTPLFFRHASFP